MATTERKQYEAFATKYAGVEVLPCASLEAQLIEIALGDCGGFTALDLGGGCGIHARRALDQGCATVDVIDISPEMMRAGKQVEAELGREDRIRWFEADVTRPLAAQLGDGVPRPEGYDVVMANWVFDHATSVEDLRGMWTNIAEHLKPGGKFLGIRVQSVHAEYMAYGKYGATFADVTEIPGGMRYQVGFLTQPPFSFECTSMESSYTLADEIPRELGLADFQVIKPEDTEVVQKDLEFWDEHLKEPCFTVVTARKP